MRAIAQEAPDPELDRIPSSIGATPAKMGDAAPGTAAPGGAARPAGSTRLNIDDALTMVSVRTPLIPIPQMQGSGFENRVSVNGVTEWTLSAGMAAHVSDRLDLDEQQYAGDAAHTLSRNDFREGYVAWQSAASLYAELGRINVKSGSALGFNPTDFFKTRTQIDTASADPSAIRNDRLGTVMARLQYLWAHGSLGAAVAPKLTAPTPLSSTNPSGLDPLFDRSNSANRVLLTANYDLADLSPQALVYRESGTTRFGLNISRTVGRSVVAYAEWAGGEQASLSARAVAYGEETRSLPPGTSILPTGNAADHFRSDLALGASWSGAHNLTVNLEYHYHQSGWSRQDWQRAFAFGQAEPATAGALLWYVREFARDRQEPTSRQQFFVRVNCTDAIIKNLELSAFEFVDAYDGSLYTQLSGAYYWSNHWTITAFATGTAGPQRSEYGSLPQARSVTLELVRYF
jgi:hypothetical protein